VIPIAPPIASRVFQELSNGIVNVQNAKKIREFPFPFPYAQMITTFLLLIWVITPCLCAMVVKAPSVSCAISFVVPFAFWSLNYIAAELELPFGDDPNDLPIAMMQVNFNESLSLLLNPLVSVTPKFEFKGGPYSSCSRHKCRLTQMTASLKGLPDEDDELQSDGTSSSIKKMVDPKTCDDEASSCELVSDGNPDDISDQADLALPPEILRLDLPPGPIPEAKWAALPVTVMASPSTKLPSHSRNGAHCMTEDNLRQLGKAVTVHGAVLFPDPSHTPLHDKGYTDTHQASFTPPGYRDLSDTYSPDSRLQAGHCKRKPPKSSAGNTPVTPSADGNLQ